MKTVILKYDTIIQYMKSPIDWFSMMGDIDDILEEHLIETTFKYIVLFIRSYCGNYKRTPLNFLVHYNTNIKTKIKLLQFNVTYSKKRVVCFAILPDSKKIPIYYYSKINGNITDINYSFYSIGRKAPYLKLGVTKRINYDHKQLYKLVSHYTNGNLTFFYEDYRKDKMIYTIVYKDDMNFYIKNIIRNSTVYNEPFVVIVSGGIVKYAIIDDIGITLSTNMIESVVLFVDTNKENVNILMKLSGNISTSFTLDSFSLCLKDIKQYTKTLF